MLLDAEGAGHAPAPSPCLAECAPVATVRVAPPLLPDRNHAKEAIAVSVRTGGKEELLM